MKEAHYRTRNLQILSLYLLLKLLQLIYKSELLIPWFKFTRHLFFFFYEDHKLSYSLGHLHLEHSSEKNPGAKDYRNKQLHDPPCQGLGLLEQLIPRQVQSMGLALRPPLPACSPKSISLGREALSRPWVGVSGPWAPAFRAGDLLWKEQPQRQRRVSRVWTAAGVMSPQNTL